MQEQVNARIWIDSQEIFMVNPEITLEAEAGDHAKAALAGILKEESRPLADTVSPMAEIQIRLGDSSDYFFWGVVTALDVRIKMSGGRQYQELSLEAMSPTCRLDQEKKCAAFQKREAAYEEVFRTVLQDNPETAYLFSDEMQGGKIGRFTVQYEETEWEFLSRITSFLHMPLVADHRTGGIKFTAGVIWKSGTYSVPAGEEWQVEVIHDGCRHLAWSPEDPGAPVFDVGDGIRYQGTEYYVKRTEAEIRDHVLYQTCLLYPREGFHVPEIENPMLTGLSLPGSVREVKGNQLRVTLDIDAFGDTDCWFVYSTFYATFYCMPEKDDRINLYFPDHLEDHSFVLNSVRADPKQAAAAFSGQKGIAGGGSDSKDDGGDIAQQVASAAVQAVDIAPYLAMLAAPENGRLINVTASMRKATTPPEQTGQPITDGSGAMQGNSAGIPGAGAREAAQEQYDFESMAQNENIKILCSRDGRMVILNDDEGSVSVVCDNGTYIKIMNSGITIMTETEISFTAKGGIHLKAGEELTMAADNSLKLECKDTLVEITPQEIKMKGTDILLNEE